MYSCGSSSDSQSSESSASASASDSASPVGPSYVSTINSLASEERRRGDGPVFSFGSSPILMVRSDRSVGVSVGHSAELEISPWSCSEELLSLLHLLVKNLCT